MKKLKIAFDIDDTLWKIVSYDEGGRKRHRQVPDYEIIQVLKWFYNNDHKVFVWSAGGLDYAQQIVDKLGLTEMVTVISKDDKVCLEGKKEIDIAFDDMDTDLAKVDVTVKRENYEEDKN